MNILDCNRAKEYYFDSLKNKISKVDKKLEFAVISINPTDISKRYLERIDLLANELDIKCYIISYSNDVKEKDIISKIQDLNNNSNIVGIMLLLPINKCFNSERIINTIDPLKDIDGLTKTSRDMLTKNKECLAGACATGIIKLLDYYNISINKMKVVILGKGNIVGKPLFYLFKNLGAKVIVCDSKTDNLKDYTRDCNILISATGKGLIINNDFISDGQILIDAGTSIVNGVLVGDFDFDNISKEVSITKVIGGVSSLTNVMLMGNVYKAYELNKKKK